MQSSEFYSVPCQVVDLFSGKQHHCHENKMQQNHQFDNRHDCKSSVAFPKLKEHKYNNKKSFILKNSTTAGVAAADPAAVTQMNSLNVLLAIVNTE